MQSFFNQGRPGRIRFTLIGLSMMICFTGICGCSQNPAIEPVTAATPRAELQDEEIWQVMYVNNQRIGYAYMQTRVEDRAGIRVIRNQSNSFMKLKRFGQELNLERHLQTVENEAGALLSYKFELNNPPAASTVSTGVVEKGALKIETKIANQPRQSQLKWESSFHSPSYMERVFKTSPLQPGEKKSFSMLLPEYNKITEVNLNALGYEEVELRDGSRQKCLHVEMEQSLLPGMRVDLYVTESGEIPKAAADFLGSSMLTYTVSKEVALEEIAGEELDLAVQTLIKVSPIPRAHETSQVVYKVMLPDDDPAKFLVPGAGQQLKQLDERSVELTVVKVPAPTEFPESKIEAEYIQPTTFLQSDDPRIVKYAAEAVQSEKNPWKMATLMERYVYQNLKKKNFSTALASASEVAENLEGDCTEHAVLLAAMLRARNLPSRVVVGLVYIPSRSSFGGHMWTEVFLDHRWIPLDATLGKGGIGAGHIKLGDSSLAENAPAPLSLFLPLLQAVGKLSIEVTDFAPKAAP